MSDYFLDSSALIKRYLRETGMSWLRALVSPTGGHVITMARITQVEVMSGVWRRRREGDMSERTALTIHLLLERHFARQYYVVELTSEITAQAMDLVRQYPLRGYDAVQLATALKSNERLLEVGQSPLIVVSADKRMLDTALALGLTTDNPNDHI